MKKALLLLALTGLFAAGCATNDDYDDDSFRGGTSSSGVQPHQGAAASDLNDLEDQGATRSKSDVENNVYDTD